MNVPLCPDDRRTTGDPNAIESVLRQEIERLQIVIDRRGDALRLQQALFAISEVAHSSRPTADVLAELHRIVGTLMYAENFFIAGWDTARRTLRFLYFADSEESGGIDPELEFHESELAGSLTLEVIRGARPLRGPSAELAAELGIEGGQQGPESNDWLGVPMGSEGEVMGAVVVQSYRPEHCYSTDDEQLLSYVGEHIASALARRRGIHDLERRVQQRTEALRVEIAERQRAERLQSALYRITALASRHETDANDTPFYAEVHGIVGELIDARNFYIAIWNDVLDEVSFPYSVDEHNPVRLPRRGGHGLTEYLIHHGEPLLATDATIRGLEAAGAISRSGDPSICWMGVPMRVEDHPVGVIAVQSYRSEINYTPRDLELLDFVATHIAAAIGRRRAGLALREAYLDLERRVAERTRELALTNETLRQQIGAREGVERQLKHQVLHDSLTNLPNRQYLLDRLVVAIAQYHAQPDRLFAVLFLDLDRF